MKACDKAFVTTKEIAEKIHKRNVHIPREKLLIPRSSANTSLFKPLEKQESRLDLQLDGSKEYVGFAGTLYEYQGIDIVINAARYILKQRPSTVFLIIGEGP